MPLLRLSVTTSGGTVESDLQTGFGATGWSGIGGGIASGCCC
eukprot:SAG31_NODE_28596_length_407_cov_7.311688_1_plen_41_part_10